MKGVYLRTISVFQDLTINILLLPLGQSIGFLHREVAPHGKSGIRKIKGVFVVLFVGHI